VEPVIQFRVALTVSDFDKALSFFRDALGLPVLQEWPSAEGRGAVLSVREAVLEVLDQNHAAFVDGIEAGRRVSGQVRFAFQVSNLEEAMAAARASGAQLVRGPVGTPWKDVIARFTGPDGLQVTLFQSPPAK
jgi:catechol 2,3-dioxygenase-like lactoylglutathione lyase family enzyme